MHLENHDRALVLGITGTGKSFWTQRHVIETHPRVVVWDPEGEYADAGATVAVPFERLAERPELLQLESLHVSVIVDWLDEDELSAAFIAFAAWCKSHLRDVVLVVEEVGALNHKAQARLAGLAARARKWGVPMAMVAQRAAMVTPSARAQASMVVAFAQREPRDLEALADRIGQERAAKVARLARYKNVIWREADALAL